MFIRFYVITSQYIFTFEYNYINRCLSLKSNNNALIGKIHLEKLILFISKQNYIIKMTLIENSWNAVKIQIFNFQTKTPLVLCKIKKILIFKWIV